MIEGLLSLSSGESSRLLIGSSGEELCERFHDITPQKMGNSGEGKRENK